MVARASSKYTSVTPMPAQRHAAHVTGMRIFDDSTPRLPPLGIRRCHTQELPFDRRQYPPLEPGPDCSDGLHLGIRDFHLPSFLREIGEYHSRRDKIRFIRDRLFEQLPSPHVIPLSSKKHSQFKVSEGRKRVHSY